MTERNLEPCPFCASRELFLTTNIIFHYVVCVTCGATGKRASSDALAVKAWNERSTTCVGCGIILPLDIRMSCEACADKYNRSQKCDKCGATLQQVRPDKWQCPECG